MVKLPSISLILGSAFISYILYSIWSLSLLFSAPECSGKPCFTSYLATNPKLQLLLFTSTKFNPVSSEVTKLSTIKSFDYRNPYSADYDVKVPATTKKNGTLYLMVVLALNDGVVEWKHLQRDGPTVIQRIPLTEFAVPKAETYNLLKSDTVSEPNPDKKPKVGDTARPVTHMKSKIYVSILTDTISMSQYDIPQELARLVRVSHKNEFLPIMQNDFLKTRLSDLERVTSNTTTFKLTFHYSPVNIGKLRLMLHVEHALSSLQQLGFQKKDIDEVKGIFSDTNVYLLCGTVFVGSIHMLFDFLSFKNDVVFWKKRKSYAGLSIRTTLWRAFTQVVIFFYLWDENTSLLVLIPAGIGVLIELWKSKKILKLEVTLSGIRFKVNTDNERTVKAEQLTREIDKEAMRYLSYLLYPLCICGAIYSLLYQPHKSWYSWTLNSLVNGVYAFGFLFMLPQLFINYKLKSVANLPWRAFMYKSFNTFIDDIFAFIITMPTSHRVACFRDDIVFIIYLYQRWLYPVDKNRIDDGYEVVDTQEPITEAVDEKKTK